MLIPMEHVIVLILLLLLLNLLFKLIEYRKLAAHMKSDDTIQGQILQGIAESVRLRNENRDMIEQMAKRLDTHEQKDDQEFAKIRESQERVEIWVKDFQDEWENLRERIRREDILGGRQK